MSSLLQSTLNTRVLPAGEGRYIRSDAPIAPTQADIRWLMEHNVTTLVDLRSTEEAASNPCPLQGREGFTYHLLPVTGGGGTPTSREHLYQVYLGMLDGQMERIINTILHAQSRVMYFCAAGKDRTGVVSAVLMKHFGCDDEAIVADYMRSGDNLAEMLTAYAAAHPEVDLNIIMPQPENILRVLAKL